MAVRCGFLVISSPDALSKLAGLKSSLYADAISFIASTSPCLPMSSGSATPTTCNMLTAAEPMLKPNAPIKPKLVKTCETALISVLFSAASRSFNSLTIDLMASVSLPATLSISLMALSALFKTSWI